MRIFAALLLTAFIAAPVLAQSDHVQRYREEVEKSPADEANEKRVQRDYQRALKNVPDQKQADPWGIARTDTAAKKPAEPAKPAMKSSKAKTDAKTAGDTN